VCYGICMVCTVCYGICMVCTVCYGICMVCTVCYGICMVCMPWLYIVVPTGARSLTRSTRHHLFTSLLSQYKGSRSQMAPHSCLQFNEFNYCQSSICHNGFYAHNRQTIACTVSQPNEHKHAHAHGNRQTPTHNHAHTCIQ